MVSRNELSNKAEVPIQIFNYLTFESRSSRFKTKEVPIEVKDLYRMYLPQIETLYGKEKLRQDLLFHGTGYLQYKREGKNHYSKEKIIPVLQNSLTFGLQPAHDEWIPTPGGMPTISLSQARFYAKWYADLHQGSENHILWEYGDSADWAVMYLLDSFSNDSFLSKIRDIAIAKKSDGHLEEGLELFRRWASFVRNNITHDTKYMNIFRGRSTIPNNFPAILVMKRDVRPFVDMPMIHSYEHRTLFPIPPKDFTVLEVPLSNMDFVKEMVHNSGLSDLPVIPMECVDLYLSQYPLSEHTYKKVHTKGKSRTDQKIFLEKSEFNFGEIAREKLDSRAQGNFPKSYHPHYLLEVLEDSPFFYNQFSQVINWEGHTLRYHTLSVMVQFEKYFGRLSELPGNVSKDFFRLFLALHDSGKALFKGDQMKKDQSYYNSLITSFFLTELQYPPEEIQLALTLLSSDPLGKYIKYKGTISQVIKRLPFLERTLAIKRVEGKLIQLENATLTQIKAMASECNMPIDQFFELLRIYHQVDGSSYTTDGGSVGSLDYVFDTNTQEKILKYNPAIESLVEELRKKIVG